jgi:hypothetical protein
LANSIAIPRPIPESDPVTMATLPSNFFMIIVF